MLAYIILAVLSWWLRATARELYGD